MIWRCIGSPQLIGSFEGVRLQRLLKKPEKQIRSRAELYPNACRGPLFARSG